MTFWKTLFTYLAIMIIIYLLIIYYPYFIFIHLKIINNLAIVIPMILVLYGGIFFLTMIFFRQKFGWNTKYFFLIIYLTFVVGSIKFIIDFGNIISGI